MPLAEKSHRGDTHATTRHHDGHDADWLRSAWCPEPAPIAWQGQPQQSLTPRRSLAHVPVQRLRDSGPLLPMSIRPRCQPCVSSAPKRCCSRVQVTDQGTRRPGSHLKSSADEEAEPVDGASAPPDVPLRHPHWAAISSFPPFEKADGITKKRPITSVYCEEISHFPGRT